MDMEELEREIVAAMLRVLRAEGAITQAVFHEAMRRLWG